MFTMELVTLLCIVLLLRVSDQQTMASGPTRDNETTPASEILGVEGVAAQTYEGQRISAGDVGGLVKWSSSEDKNLTNCYSCENCSTVTKSDLAQCSIGQDKCLTSISNGVVNRGCGNSDNDIKCQQNGEIFLCACSGDGCNEAPYYDVPYSPIRKEEWNLICYSCVDCEYIDYELTKNVTCHASATACIKMTSNGITTRGCSCGSTNQIGYRCVTKLGITTCTCGTSYCNGSGRAYIATVALLITAIIPYLTEASRSGE